MIKIGEKIIGDNRPCFIIAEAGVNHNGDIEIAKKLIDIAVNAGVDAVKFQTWITEELVTEDIKKASYQTKSSDSKESFFDMLKKLEFNIDQFNVLKDYCDDKGIIFLSTPDDEKSLDSLHELGVPAFKTSSGDLTNSLMIEKVAKKGLPLIMSTGMSSMAQVKEVVDNVRRWNDSLVILHCTTSYPAQLADVNMNAMISMKKELDILVGYSDHTQGIIVPLVAASQGACVIEKHITFDKKAKGPDHKASIDYEELKMMVSAIREFEKLGINEKKNKLSTIEDFNLIMGSKKKKPAKSEYEAIQLTRKYFVFNRNVKKGEQISSDMLTLKRTGKPGISPENISLLIGKFFPRSVKRDYVIQKEDIS